MSKLSQLRANPLFYQLLRFGVVGLSAAAVHFSVVVILVQATLLLPIYANIIGFLCGFQISYWGHKLWTFQSNETLHRVAIPRLFLVQTVAFFANETLFYVLLMCKLPYPLALIFVLMIIPVFTYASSRLWVFR